MRFGGGRFKWIVGSADCLNYEHNDLLYESQKNRIQRQNEEEITPERWQQQEQ